MPPRSQVLAPVSELMPMFVSDLKYYRSLFHTHVGRSSCRDSILPSRICPDHFHCYCHRLTFIAGINQSRTSRALMRSPLASYVLDNPSHAPIHTTLSHSPSRAGPNPGCQYGRPRLAPDISRARPRPRWKSCRTSPWAATVPDLSSNINRVELHLRWQPCRTTNYHAKSLSFRSLLDFKNWFQIQVGVIVIILSLREDVNTFI